MKSCECNADDDVCDNCLCWVFVFGDGIEK